MDQWRWRASSDDSCGYNTKYTLSYKYGCDVCGRKGRGHTREGWEERRDTSCGFGIIVICPVCRRTAEDDWSALCEAALERRERLARMHWSEADAADEENRVVLDTYGLSEWDRERRRRKSEQARAARVRRATARG